MVVAQDVEGRRHPDTGGWRFYSGSWEEVIDNTAQGSGGDSHVADGETGGTGSHARDQSLGTGETRDCELVRDCVSLAIPGRRRWPHRGRVPYRYHVRRSPVVQLARNTIALVEHDFRKLLRDKYDKSRHASWLVVGPLYTGANSLDICHRSLCQELFFGVP
jgi:hypothetical protein